MRKIGGFISYLYLHMDLGFIIKSYAYAVVFMVMMFCFGHSSTNTFGFFIYYVVCIVIFPFGHLAIHDLLALFSFDGFFLMPVAESIMVTLFIWLMKFILYIMVWMFGIITAPVGVLYIVLGDVFADWAQRWRDKRKD